MTKQPAGSKQPLERELKLSCLLRAGNDSKVRGSVDAPGQIKIRMI
jgi:hypothetical protein